MKGYMNSYMDNRYTPEELENNRLICEFLGALSDVTWENHITGEKTFKVKSPLVKIWRNQFKNTGGFEDSMLLQNTRFHNDWNWLNMVIDKITTLDYSVQLIHQKWHMYDGHGVLREVIYPLTCKISDTRQFLRHEKERYSNEFAGNLYSTNHVSKIKGVYDEIIKFIKWHNHEEKK